MKIALCSVTSSAKECQADTYLAMGAGPHKHRGPINRAASMTPNKPATRPPAPNSNPLKRKRADQDSAPNRKRRPNIHEARAIASQTKDKAYGDGELNVEKFVKAREFEIKALEDGMKKSKNFLSQRAFQSVPRDLRRRTASHNVKRVPKRLRARAQKEVDAIS